MKFQIVCRDFEIKYFRRLTSMVGWNLKRKKSLWVSPELLTSGDDRHVDDRFATASLRNGTLYALMVHTSNWVCSPLHSLDSPIDLLKNSPCWDCIAGQPKKSYLRNFGVTTFHCQRPRQHETEPVLYLAIVIVDCDDERRVDYFGRAKSDRREERSGNIKINSSHDAIHRWFWHIFLLNFAINPTQAWMSKSIFKESINGDGEWEKGEGKQ